MPQSALCLLTTEELVPAACGPSRGVSESYLNRLVLEDPPAPSASTMIGFVSETRTPTLPFGKAANAGQAQTAGRGRAVQGKPSPGKRGRARPCGDSRLRARVQVDLP